MNYTGSSCEEIYYNNPETGDKSGYYRVNDQWTYCNMKEITTNMVTPTTTVTVLSTTTVKSTFTKTITLSKISPTPTPTPTTDFIPTCAGVGGGWKRIVNINISAGDDCPSGWRKDTHSGVSFCRVVSDDLRGCSSASFSTNGTSYQRVCGRARGYQKGETDAFYAYYNKDKITVEDYYADGLLITYGIPHQHIWTFAAGLYDNKKYSFNCPCAFGGGKAPPPLVGTNYYCESSSVNTYYQQTYYFNDPLWDGSDCYSSTDCCSNPTQPWFYRELGESTTSDIEARICSWLDFNQYGSTLIDQLEL